MSGFVKPLMDWFVFGMVIETGSKFCMVPFPTQKVTDSEFLYKSFVINVLQFHFFFFFFFFFFAKPSMDLINYGVTIEPCLRFYAVPSQSQCMTLRSRSQTLIVLCVKSLQFQLLQSLWLIWILFGMNGYKILKCFRKKRVSGELPCTATGLICLCAPSYVVLFLMLYFVFVCPLLCRVILDAVFCVCVPPLVSCYSWCCILCLCAPSCVVLFLMLYFVFVCPSCVVLVLMLYFVFVCPLLCRVILDAVFCVCVPLLCRVVLDAVFCVCMPLLCRVILDAVFCVCVTPLVLLIVTVPGHCLFFDSNGCWSLPFLWL